MSVCEFESGKVNVEINTIDQQQQQRQRQQQHTMGDNPNGENDGGDSRKISTSEETEKDDKFPQQMNNKNANWNMMELGEKRKRLR